MKTRGPKPQMRASLIVLELNDLSRSRTKISIMEALSVWVAPTACSGTRTEAS